MSDTSLTREQAARQLNGLLSDFKGIDVPFVGLAVDFEIQRLANRCCAPLLLHGDDGRTVVFKPKMGAWGEA